MDRNTLLAFFLIALVLVLTPYYMDVVSPPPPALPEESDKDEHFIDPEEPIFSEDGAVVEKDKKTKKGKAHQKSQLQINSAQEKTIDVETDLFTALISSNGGGHLKSFAFKNFYREDSQMVDLINGANRENISLAVTDVHGGRLDLAGAWHYDGYFVGGKIRDELTLSFYLEILPGKKITKSLTFYPDKYLVDIDIDISDISDRVFAGIYSLSWNGGLASTEKNEKDDFVYFYSYILKSRIYLNLIKTLD